MSLSAPSTPLPVITSILSCKAFGLERKSLSYSSHTALTRPYFFLRGLPLWGAIRATLKRSLTSNCRDPEHSRREKRRILCVTARMFAPYLNDSGPWLDDERRDGSTRAPATISAVKLVEIDFAITFFNFLSPGD